MPTADRIEPTDADALYRAALAAHERGALRDAVSGYRAVLAVAPGHASALGNLGTALQTLGDHDGAIASHRRALDAGAPPAPVYANLGMALRAAGRLDEARDALERAVALDPKAANAHLNLGNVLRAAGDPEAALGCYRAAQVLAPADPAAFSNAALALKDLDRHGDAVDALRTALERAPASAELHYNLANTLHEMGLVEAAEAAFHQALGCDPNHLNARANLGVLHREIGDIEGALAAFDSVLARDPHHANAHWNRALALLLAGDFAPGWAAYEWRWQATPLRPRALPMPRWAGEDLRGRRILLWAEQGYGDTVQFVRFAANLGALGARVVAQVQAPLVRLLEPMDPLEAVLDERAPPPACDYHAPLMSLPGLLGLAAPPPGEPYLPAPAAAPALAEAIAAARGRRIGVVWAGNPSHENDAKRSCAAVHFAPLAARANTQLFSLQLNAQEALRDIPGAIDLAPYLSDFADTASAIAALDLVISVDTAVAHIAGALGRPVWLLLPHAPDWRWMLAREDSPWYPTMRLFRQREPGDWRGVFARVEGALDERQATGRGENDGAGRILQGAGG